MYDVLATVRGKQVVNVDYYKKLNSVLLVNHESYC